MAVCSRRRRPGIVQAVSMSSVFEIAFQLCLLWTTVTGNSLPDFTEFRFTVEPSDAVAYKGRPLRLDCVAFHGGGKIPSIRWIKDGEFINLVGDSRRQKLPNNGSLFLSDVEHGKLATDAGKYQCMATTDDGFTILSRPATVQIAYISRSFKTEPQDVEVYLTNTAMFQCAIDGVPRPNITWFKDDKLLVDKTGNLRTYPDGVLQISDVKFRDFGNYLCLAEGTDKTRRSKESKLLQKNAEEGFQGIKPIFTLRPQDTKALIGSKVVLFCGAYGLDSAMQPPVILWLKDGVTIDFTKTQGRLTIIEGSNLQILNLEEDDDGTYMCRADNDVDSIDAEAKLTVIVPPTFVKQLENVYAHTKHDILLDCHTVGKPTPMVTFYKNGDPVNPGDYFEIVEGQSLRIMGLVRSDSGYYQCFAQNEAGSVQSGAQLLVLNQGAYPPVDSSTLPSPPTKLSAAITSTRFVTLSWGLPDEPGPAGPSEIITYSVNWKELGSERERMMNSTIREVNIQKLKPNTEYRFEVRAYNQYGSSESPTTIRVTTDQEVDVPSEAQNVRALPLSPTAIEVRWDPPAKPKGTLEYYFLIYYPVGAQEENQVKIMPTERMHVLSDLLCFQEYSFRIVAYNANGPGMSTEEVVARTYSDKPSDFPQNFTLETSSSTSIVVRWQPPPPKNRNGQITGYKIRYKKRGARRGNTVTTDGNRDLYALTDLKKNTEYQVRISAQTVNGSGPATDWEYTRTYEDDLDESRVPDIPLRLMVRPLSGSLVVQWVPNRQSEILVRGYYLGYGKGVPDVFRQVFDADTFFYTIENLQPASEYVVSIRAFNNQGEGQPRYETVFTKENKIQEPMTPMLPPIGLKAIVLSPHTIVVTWTDDSLGKIQRITDNRYYTVRYNTVPASRGRYRYLNATDLNCHIDDLKPATQYEFSVRVIKGRRQSTWSMAVTNTTQESSPGSVPRDLTLVRVKGDPLAVTLNWQPPAKPNGQITGYLVFYTTDNTQPDREWVLDGVVGETLSATIRDLTEDTEYFFKVQARNSKGYGPMSPTKSYKTPALRNPGVGSHIKPGGRPASPEESTEEKEDKEENSGLPKNVVFIIIACVGGVTFCFVVAVVTFILCRRRDAAERNKRANMYKGSPTKNKGMKPPPPQENQPPDLWIDHDHLELKHMDKGQRAESSLTLSSMRRNSHDTKSIDTLPQNTAEVYHSSSEAEEKLLPPPNYNQIVASQRSIVRPKPLMLPVDQQGHQREPVATVTAYPNGQMMPRYTQGQMPPSPSEDSGVIPMRPVYPRTQYQMQYGTQGPPRVNAGDISQPSSMHGYPVDYGYRLVPCIAEEEEARYPEPLDESLGGRVGYGYMPGDPHHSNRGNPEKMPITGIASPVISSEHTHSLPRSVDPLKSFSVPEPPNPNPILPRGPSTPNTPRHIVKPQQTATPYKKPTPPISSGPIKPRSSPMPVITPKAPDVTLKTGKEDRSDIQKSLSTEELTAEMANLEGLMKDLNAITQQDFEC